MCKIKITKSKFQRQSVTPKFMEMASCCFVFIMIEDKQIILFVIQIATYWHLFYANNCSCYEHAYILLHWAVCHFM